MTLGMRIDLHDPRIPDLILRITLLNTVLTVCNQSNSLQNDCVKACGRAFVYILYPNAKSELFLSQSPWHFSLKKNFKNCILCQAE